MIWGNLIAQCRFLCRPQTVLICLDFWISSVRSEDLNYLLALKSLLKGVRKDLYNHRALVSGIMGQIPKIQTSTSLKARIEMILLWFQALPKSVQLFDCYINLEKDTFSFSAK